MSEKQVWHRGLSLLHAVKRRNLKDEATSKLLFWFGLACGILACFVAMRIEDNLSVIAIFAIMGTAWSAHQSGLREAQKRGRLRLLVALEGTGQDAVQFCKPSDERARLLERIVDRCIVATDTHSGHSIESHEDDGTRSVWLHAAGLRLLDLEKQPGLLWPEYWKPE